jgi:hypothetical protein
MSRRNTASTRAFLTDVLGLAHDVASDLTQFLLQANIYDPQVSGVYIVFGKTLGAESDWFRMIETVWGVPISEEATYALIFEDKPTGALLVRRSLRLVYVLFRFVLLLEVPVTCVFSQTGVVAGQMAHRPPHGPSRLAAASLGVAVHHHSEKLIFSVEADRCRDRSNALPGFSGVCRRD